MPISEEDRSDLYQKFCELAGKKVTNTLMEMLPPYDWSDIARTTDVGLLRKDIEVVYKDIELVRRDMEALGVELRQEMSQFRTEMNGRLMVLDERFDRLNRTLGWLIGGFLTVGTGVMVMLVQLSFQVASLK